MVKYLKWFLPVLFIAYYGSVSFFMHVHIEHGTTIVHAHPFKKTADGTCNHHRTLAEIQLFSALSSIHVVDGAIHLLQLHFYARPVGEVSESVVSSDHLAPTRGKIRLRAPPFIA